MKILIPNSRYYVYDRFEPLRTIEAVSDDFVNREGVCSLRIDSLESGVIYGYDVCGTNGVRHSVPSDIVKVVDKGIMGVDKIDTEVKDAPTVIYNLQGIPMSRDLHDLPSGIYIFNGKKISI